MLTHIALCSFEEIFQEDKILLHIIDPNILRSVTGNSKAGSAIVNPQKYVIIGGCSACVSLSVNNTASFVSKRVLVKISYIGKNHEK